MAGLVVNVKIGGEIRHCAFDDTDMSGGNASALSLEGKFLDSTYVATTADVALDYIESPGDGRISHSHFDVADVTVTNGIIQNCKVKADRLILSGVDGAVQGSEVYLSPDNGDNEGILLSGELCAVLDTLIVAVNPYATDTQQAISITGDYCLVDGLRFRRSASKSWEYLIEDVSGTATVGVYSTTPTAYATGEIAP